MIGDLEKSSFSNIENMSREFVVYTLNPWLIRWEQTLHKALFDHDEKKSYLIKFNVDGLLRGDYQSRMSGYAIGIQNGFMSPNDARRLEEMDLIPDELGGNLYMTNGNLCPLSMAGAAYKSKEQEENKDG